MLILGVNAYHADASACLIRDGQLVAAAEEERFTRVKHWAGFPTEAVRYCLREGGVTIHDVDHLAVNRDPQAHLAQKALYAFLKRPNWQTVRDRLRNAGKIHDLKAALAEATAVRPEEIRTTIRHIEHHQAHLASAFYVSGFQEAAVASIDGFGDFVSTRVGRGKGLHVEVMQSVFFPHSLGLFYLALTQYLGFHSYGDEYKVMGLAAYGQPEYLEVLRQLVRLKSRGRFDLNLDYFRHQSDGVAMTWDGGMPSIGQVYSEELVKLLGPARQKDEPLTARHQHIAASMQALYEEACFHILNDLYDRTHLPALCLAGGCALNGVANGKLTERTPFEWLYVPPVAGDAGGAIGAAFAVWHQVLGSPRTFVMQRADWGPSFNEREIQLELDRQREPLAAEGWTIDRYDSETELCQRTAKEVAAGRVMGWFQGRMELGARALGQRSIVADPRRPNMKEILNARIKRRESFRPFAPSILEEAAEAYFEQTQLSPFMTMTARVKQDKLVAISACTHVDGTGRVQTVSRATQPLYWQLIKSFEDLTGVPVLLNTSFNEQEPIVCTPHQAVACLLRTQMDGLAIGPYVITRQRTANEKDSDKASHSLDEQIGIHRSCGASRI
ncbi:MAG: carbamoyltransferase [Chloroflexi bacterium]|nr:MAG: carbamoyltransferase [Chloroflexota bacterium]